MIKRRHTKPYEHKIRSNKVEYSTYEGLYCTMHDAKVPFLMPEFSTSKSVLNCFHIDNN